MNVSSILATYVDAKKTSGPNTTIELELRFDIGARDVFKSMLNKVIGKSNKLDIVRSVNIFKEGRADTGFTVATRYFEEKNGVVEDSGRQTIWFKKRLAMLHSAKDVGMSHRLTVNEETIRTSVFKQAMNDKTRIKLRLSVEIDEFPGWRFDFTIVVSTTLATTRAWRTALFLPGLTVDNFVEQAPWEPCPTGDNPGHGIVSYELEVESISDAPNEKDIESIVAFVNGNAVEPSASLQQEIYNLAKLLEAKGLERFKNKAGFKNIGVSPNSNINMYHKQVRPNITKFFVSEKADGERVIGVIGNGKHVMIGSTLTVFESKSTTDIVYEGELVDGKVYVFDVLMFDGAKLFERPFAERIEFIDKVLPHSDILFRKNHTRLTSNFCQEIKNVFNEQHPYEIDGLVFTDGRCAWWDSVIYKWKPLEFQTIDFLVMYSDRLKCHVLFCGIGESQKSRYRIKKLPGYSALFNHKRFTDTSPIQFSPAGRSDIWAYTGELPSDANGRVCEFRWAGDKFEFVKVRADKDNDVATGCYFGNNIAVAMSTWNAIHHPVSIDMLCEEGEQYFGKTDTMYKNVNGFNNYVRYVVLDSIKSDLSGCRLVDFAAGRGADLNKWYRAGVARLLALDNDRAALDELLLRHASSQRKMEHVVLDVLTHKVNLNDDGKVTMATLRKLYSNFWEDRVSVAVCHMAIHYMCESKDSVANFANMVASVFDGRGKFGFCCYDGKKVFDMLAEENPVIKSQDGVVKYHIVKDYVGSDLAPAGQKIRTLLGFTGGELREEYLVNVDYICEVFGRLGFRLVSKWSFDEFLEKYSIDEGEAKYDRLTEDDIWFTSLYVYVILEKI